MGLLVFFICSVLQVSLCKSTNQELIASKISEASGTHLTLYPASPTPFSVAEILERDEARVRALNKRLVPDFATLAARKSTSSASAAEAENSTPSSSSAAAAAGISKPIETRGIHGRRLLRSNYNNV